jgi:hypothetical protein
MTPASALTRYYGSLFKTIALGGVRLASSGHNTVRFEPYFSEDSRVIIPVSFSRYVVRDDLSAKRAAEYDNFLAAIFNRTAYLLQSGLIARVDILSTGYVQRVHWNDTLVDEVEKHFLNTHADILSKQSNVYTLDQWIGMKGRDLFEERYKSIVSESAEGSEWYDLMLRTQKVLKNSGSIEQSLAYQRTEYTAMSLMGNEYTHLVYAGPISIGWGYLYKKYADIPTFSQVSVEKMENDNKHIQSYDAEQTTRLLLSNIKQVLTNPQFPPDKKEGLINSCMALCYTYGGLTNKSKPSKIACPVPGITLKPN